MVDLIQLLILIGIGYFVGTRVEKSHYQSILRREGQLVYLPVVQAEEVVDDRPVRDSRMVYGSVVISTDYFKTIVAGLRNMLGGEMCSFETILDRGRREAVLRLKEKAPDADIIVNLRLETNQIGLFGTAEVLAYGTALYYAK
jgi:uncharacterized protein YbjQ (UPF0145 family)